MKSVNGDALGGPDAEAQKQLLSGTYEFRLGRAVSVQGSVVDSSGQPVPEAKITVGQVNEVNTRQAVSGSEGQFCVVGCKPGKTLLTAARPRALRQRPWKWT